MSAKLNFKVPFQSHPDLNHGHGGRWDGKADFSIFQIHWKVGLAHDFIIARQICEGSRDEPGIEHSLSPHAILPPYLHWKSIFCCRRNN